MDDAMDDAIDTYRTYMQSQCSYWSPESSGYLSGEIVSQWFQRKSIQREMAGLQADLSRKDGVLSGLLFEQKKKLSSPGRNGRWSAWLKQNKIPRATADRLVLEHIEFFGLHDELPKRERFESARWKISRAAFEVGERHEQMLKASESKITFLWCLANRLGVAVDFAKDGSVRLSTPPPEKPEDIEYRVPNVITIAEDGTVQPVDYELKDEGGESDSAPQNPPDYEDVL